MSERVEEIRRTFNFDPWALGVGDTRVLLEHIESLTNALAQAERERDEAVRAAAAALHERDAEMGRLKGEHGIPALEKHVKGPTGQPPVKVNPALDARLQEEMDWHAAAVEGQQKAEADLARVRAALETAANRLDIAASVIRSGAKFARWADEARAALEGRG